MKRNQVILIHGLPASGKYTVAKKMQEKCGGILLDNHYFYDLFTDMTEDTDEKWSEYTEKIAGVRDVCLDLPSFHIDGELAVETPIANLLPYVFGAVFKTFLEEVKYQE